MKFRPKGYGGWWGGTTRWNALKRAADTYKEYTIEPTFVPLPVEELRRRVLTNSW